VKTFTKKYDDGRSHERHLTKEVITKKDANQNQH
jgi:hypothetical protein